MPDKSKRRKNNKNKRKNKGHQQNNNTNARITTEVNEQGSNPIEQSDSVSKEKEETTEIQQEVEGDININLTEPQIPLDSKSETRESTKNDASFNQDEQIQLKSDIKIMNKENTPLSVSYKVESPEKTIKSKQKLKSDIKSKSVDSDDQPTIVEIVGDIDKQETSNVKVDTSHVLITEFEPDIEWEKTDDIKNFSYVLEENPVPGVLSVTTIPLNLAECEVIKSMSPEDEKSLRQYLNTLNLSTNAIDSTSLELKSEIEELVNQDIKQRLRKKGFGEESFSSRPGPARSLHVIDEEASGESSSDSRRHSYLNDRKSDEELEDDVFHPTNDIQEEIKSRKGRKSNNLINQECFRVDAQIKNPEISEARGSWTTTTVEKMTGAEIVYLTDSSSSTSSLYDNNEIEEKNEDSDVSIRIITPTIEVVDTDNFLKNDFNCNFDKSLLDDKIKNNLQEENQKQNQHFDNVISENNHTESENKNVSKENHEIVVLSTDTINTNLFVKDIEKPNLEDQIPLTETKKVVDNYDLEIKVLKCELNDAINNLIKEVASDSDTTQDCNNDSLERQDSSSSIGSSQCTAKYNPKCSSLTDISSTEFDDVDKGTVHLQKEDSKSHIKDVIKKIEDINVQNDTHNIIQTPSLRDICLEKICKLPYGKQILEELANVSERLQTLSDHAIPIGFSRLTTSKDINLTSMKQNISELNALSSNKIVSPPPIKPRNSSLKINHDDPVKINSIKSDPKRFICQSPSQKMLMEKTNSVIQDKNSEIFKERENADNKNEASIFNNKKTFDISFKSQTGSRLLALLRNPSLTPSSPEQKLSDEKDTKLYETHTSQDLTFTSRFPEYSVHRSNVQDVYKKANTFKPIPPPKPRKYSSSFYESDASSDFADNSFKSVKNSKKYFHFSTGNLSQEIVDDISSIQNMHRHYNDIYRQAREDLYPRRPSLPKDLCDQQMEYIRQKEKEVEAEIYRLENDRIKTPQRKGPRAPMLDEEFEENSFKSFNLIKNSQSYGVLPSHIPPSSGKLSSAFSKSQEELIRDKMYSEYVTQMSEREERKQKKVIKITKTPLLLNNKCSKSSSELSIFDPKVNNRIEKEFIDKAKERWNKLGIRDPETEDEYDKNCYKEPKVIEHKIKVIDSGEEKDVKKLPNHLQDFVKFRAKDKSDTPDSPETVMIAPTFKARSTSPAVWTPGAQPPAGERGSSAATPPVPPPPPVWTPSSATASPQTSRKSFRPVHFEESPPSRRKFENKEQNGCTSGSESENRLRTSHSAPVTGFDSLGSKLPKAPNPTVTLLQRAREGQLSRASQQPQIENNSRLPRDRPSPPFGDPIHALRRGYVSEGEGERREQDSTRKMADTQKKIDGIGPITKDGMPVALRSEVKDPSRWYKRMYDTIHKNKYDDDYVTIRYKSRKDEPQRVSSGRSQYAYFDPRSGYLSEPEGGLSRLTSGTWSDAYDSDVTSGPRRRTASVQEERRNDVTSPYLSNNKYSTLASTRVSQEVYKSQPGKIENYTPGKSSVVDKEAKQWWDEVMDIFDGQKMSTTMSTTSLPQKEKKDVTSAILSKSNMARALKESGYESDSTLVFKRREDTEAPLSPAERRAAYRDLQAGGEPPLRGFRSPAPPRTEESEIEYIPISSTLTKIRVHKTPPSVTEVICYPITNIETNRWINRDKESPIPPLPPRRVSSRSSHTLQLITSTKPKSVSPKRLIKTPTNVDFIKEKISNKLNRQNTHLILKTIPSNMNTSRRNTSTSAPPALSRHKSSSLSISKVKNSEVGVKNIGTSSFSSPRRTIQPTEYSTPTRSKYSASPTSIIIEGGAGRKTPISNILDKVTPIDKLWGSQKRNERIDLTKFKAKSDKNKNGQSKTTVNKPLSSSNKISTLIGVTHKSRDMVRTSEKIQKLKSHAQSTPCLLNKRDDRQIKPNIKTLAHVSKSSSNISSHSKRASVIKMNEVSNKTNKKKSLETVIIKPKVVPCHEQCNKNKSKEQKLHKITHKKDIACKKKKKDSSTDTKFSSQFGDSMSEFNLEENLHKSNLHVKEIKTGRDAIMSNSFFQHLFFQNADVPVTQFSDTQNVNSVLEKAKMFQTFSSTSAYYVPSAINTYLIHRKPVSLSKFKIWDKNESPSRAPTPRSISWPGRMDGKIKKFESLLKCKDEFGSSMSLSTIRSNSEPPTNKLYFSQTSRPKSPVVVFHKKRNDEDLEFKLLDKYSSTSKIVYKQPQHVPEIKIKTNLRISKSPSITPVSLKTKEYGLGRDYPSTIFFSQSSRPISPKVLKTPATEIRSQSTSPVQIRSPSYRRINNVKSQHKTTVGVRPRSADSSEKKHFLSSYDSRSKNDTCPQYSDPEYEEYIQDIQNNKSRSDRFRELNRYYSYLERVGELEKATSITDLRHRRKDEDIVDFDRWKKIRAIERAEEELNNLYEKLKIAQIEKDFLFYPRDVKDFRWNCEKERGLKVKEKSVEDLKDDLLQKSSNRSQDVEPLQKKDVYKPLWRGKSVAETADSINKKNECNDIDRPLLKPTFHPNKDISLGDLRKKIGIGNRLWSSLSLDQVNKLKNQLNAIYSKEMELKSQKDMDKYTVDVTERDKNYNSNLHVRCSSLSMTPSNDILKELNKSKSIAAICPVSSEKDIKNNVNKIQMSLSESEKKNISQTLSKEVIRRMKDTKNNSDENIHVMTEDSNVKNICNLKLVTNNRHVVYTSDKEEFPSSTSETETGGSDKSCNTVIYVAPKKEVQKKVEYFESVKNLPFSSSTQNESIIHTDLPKNKLREISAQGYISQSQSCTNIKELFGESDKNKFLSLPSKPDLYSRSSSPYSEAYISDRRSPDTLRFSSDETIWRSRSPSPDPERYWRAFLKLARAGEVRRLARRFDTATITSAILRRHRSDPEINNIGLKNCLCSDKSISHRQRCKTSYTVARVPLRGTNRFMPHIDIISKLAALKRRTAPRSRSAEEALECRPGEVERIRKQFEVMSLLGKIYSSAPDVRELEDIAPYLEGSWIAHRYPKPSDNNRSVSDPKTFVRGRLSPGKKEVKKQVPKESLKLNSILKSDGNEGQEFHPSAHRPISRYEPPRAPARPPPAEWPSKLAPLVTTSRHTVKFQETDSAPEPPQRMPHSSFSDTESPSRRYVESDVNIHYRCPVRHDPLPLVPERELARQQAEHMKRLYREQKRNKYLQELQDMQSRRHQDNFMPSQKTIVPLNRYDEADRVVARALYTFNGQTSRELSFRKGDIINVRRQIDNNWYEGEFHGRIGLFPYNYVELLKGDVAQSPKKPVILEGRARAKFDFTAQTNLELPLKKGELVVLTRRIDHNWWEGRLGNKTGIFPDSYVTILQEPSQSKSESQPILSTDKPVASPAAHGVVNGDKRSLGAHAYVPQHNSAALSNAPPATEPLIGYPVKGSRTSPADRSHSAAANLNNTEPLYVDTNAEAVPYRAMYKYRPQNPDELEMNEGDTVYVLEKCDDGWYVGSSQRTGRFGTFPGNYVERI